MLFCSEACRSAALSSSHSPMALPHPLRPHPPQPQSLLLRSPHPSLLPCLLPPLSPTSCPSRAPHPLLAYDSHGAEKKKKEEDEEDKSLFLRSFISSISPEFASFSPQLVSALLAKDKLNASGPMEAFAAGSGERAVRAYAIYPRASLFNHVPPQCLQV